MNQNPEQLARDEIDRQLRACGWVVQDKKMFNLSAASGVAIRKFQTSVSPADYVLFVHGKPVGLIEAKREDEGVYKMIKDLAEAIKADKPTMAPVEVTIPFREANTPGRSGSFRVRAVA